MLCDFRLSSVEKKTLQKRRAITIFDHIQAFGQCSMNPTQDDARRANRRFSNY